MCYEMGKRCSCPYNMDNNNGRKNVNGCAKKSSLRNIFSVFFGDQRIIESFVDGARHKYYFRPLGRRKMQNADDSLQVVDGL